MAGGRVASSAHARSPDEGAATLPTAVGVFPLHEYHLRLGGREWTILHTGAVLSFEEEQRYLSERGSRPPYGVALWPAAIALAHDILARPGEFRGRSVLELGAGTGLPGIVAASVGARVLQTERQDVALSICRRNGERNGVRSVAYRQADWADWHETECHDWIIGADVLYAEATHTHLRRIFDANLAAGGRVLLSDPFRPISLRALEALETSGWKVEMSRWTVGEASAPRQIGVFELTRRG